MMTSYSYVIDESLATVNSAEDRIAMGIGNSMLHTRGEEDAVKKYDRNDNHDNLEVESIVCDKKLHRDIHGSENKAGNNKMVMESSGNEQTSMCEENEDNLCKSSEPERMDVIQDGIRPSVTAIGRQQIGSKDPNRSNCSKDDISVNTVCKDESHVTSDSTQLVLKVKRTETFREIPSKHCGIHPNERLRHSCLEEHSDLNQDDKRSPKPIDSIPILEKLETMITGVTVTEEKTPDECFIDEFTEGQQCENDEPGVLKENNCNTNNESDQKEKEKYINDSQINFPSVDASSDIVANESFHDNLQQQFDDNSIEKKVSEEVESISDYRSSNSSVRETADQSISDLSTNVGTDILNMIQTASIEIHNIQNENNKISPVIDCYSDGNLPKQSLFLRGSFPRIALRAAGKDTVRRIQNRILRERKKRERALSRSDCEGTSIKVSRPLIKQKSVNRKSGVHCSERDCKKIVVPDPTNDPKLKCLLVVRIERIEERLLSKYKVDLHNNDRKTAENNISDENRSSKRTNTRLEDSANYQMLKDSGIDILENAKLPIKKVIKEVSMGSEVKKTKFKPYGAKLIKPVSVQIVKMDDAILSKYGYGSQKVKTSPIAKSIRDDYKICKKITDEQLKLNRIKYPAEICLTKIDYVYPSIVKQTLKLNKNSRNSKVVNKSSEVSASNVSNSHNNHNNDLIKINVSIDDVALSKHDCGVNVANKSADIRPVPIQSQEKLTPNKQTAFKHCEFGNSTLNVLKTSQKRKMNSYNGATMDDFSKENVCLNGELWNLKHARVSLTKLDHSELPKFSSPSLL